MSVRIEGQGETDRERDMGSRRREEKGEERSEE